MKKISLFALISTTAFFAACGDDSSSDATPKELPKSVKTFEELIKDTECSADVKCAQVLVEEYGDTYECDGEGNWNMVMETMPSKVCPAEAASSESKAEESETKSSDSKAEEPAESTDSKKEEASSDDKTPTEDKKTEEPSTPAEEKKDESFEMLTENVVSCDIPGLMHSCFVVDNTKADALNANCGLMEGTLGTACPTGAVKKCELSNGMTEYLYNASDDCQG